MADYPGGVYSPTTTPKIDGVHDVMADDVNGLDAEVIAIETELLRVEDDGDIVLEDNKDLFANADNLGLFERLVNYGKSGITDHWKGAGDDDPGWLGWAAYTGYITPDTITHSGSKKRLASSVSGKAFYYRNAIATDAIHEVEARIAIAGPNCGGGIMIDDGSNAGDGAGANNFIRLYWEDAGSGLVQLRYDYRTGGGAVTTAVTGTVLNQVAYRGVEIRLGTSGTRWTNYKNAWYQLGEGGIMEIANITGLAWTPVYFGLFFYRTGTANGVNYDWYKEA